MNVLRPQPEQSTSNPKQSTTKVAIVVVIVVAILMPVVWYFVLYRESLASMKQISAEALVSQEDRIRERQTTLTSLQALDAQYSALDRSVTQTIIDAIPKEPLLPELIVNISQIIQDSGGSLEDFSLSDQIASKEMDKVKVNTTVIQLSIGDISYELMKQLIKTIYQNGRVLSIRSLEYVPQDSAVSLSIEAYSF